MKRISLILAGVVLGTLVWAKGPDKPAIGSSVAVIKVEGSSLFKLLYKSQRAQSVRISLLDGKGNSIFNETLKNTNGFVRPYNFSGVEEGQYAIQVQDENGTTVEKISYVSEKIEKSINVSKLQDQNKYVLRITSPKKDEVTINIYDRNSTLLHTEKQSVDKAFSQVYNMKELESFTIEVSDRDGVLKTISY